MNAFGLTLPWEYKDENFFPSINDEYRQGVRFGFKKLLLKDDLEAITALAQERNAKIKAILATKDQQNYVIRDPFKLERPCYRRKYNKQPRRSAEIGSVFDLMDCFQGQGATSLVRCLKNDDADDVTFQVVDPVTSLKGKHVLLVSVFVPSKWCGYNAARLCRLWVLSKEIASVDDFEILIVAKMRNKYETNMAAFNQFFSGFPNRLAISFDCHDLRDELCYNLNFHGRLTGILIDPCGKIVRDHIGFIDKYGASAFPFSDDRLKAVEDEDMSSLTTLLRCHPSTRFYKFGFPSESISVEQLSKKLVGLYLFRGGDKLRMLHEVYRQCQLNDKANGVEPQFEIVLFCLPVDAVDPSTFELEVHQLLNKLKPDIDVSSWWVCPYDNSAGVRLLNKCRWFYGDVDALISIGADGEFIDFCGGEMLRNIGIDAYPFSLKALIQRYVEWADQVTLESLFTCGTFCVDKLVKQDGSHINVKELQFKNVVLYVDSVPSHRNYGNLYGRINKWYHKIKEYEADVEAVFVPYTGAERCKVCQPEWKSDIPWILCPYHPELASSLEHHPSFYGWCDGSRIFKGIFPTKMILFGKGGRIQVLDAMRYMLCEDPDSNPFSAGSRDLRRDIYRQMESDMDFIRSTDLREYI